MNPLISIIIPVFNHAHTLERCFKSIFEQTYRPLEIIVVNDGSTDNFDEVIKKIENKNKNLNLNLSLKTLRQENKGAAAARNCGFRESSGAYVIFWDADTVAKPDMLEKLKKQLDEHPEASYAYSQFKFGWKKFKCQEFNADDLKKNNYIDTTSLIRRSALVRPSQGGSRGVLAGPFDPSLKRFQDWDLWLTLLEQNKTGAFVPEVLYTKIVHGRKGMSSWLPKFFYKLRPQSKKIQEFNEAKKIILKKHSLLSSLD
jgi:glycosyltransferase involved in cell wall biosynthesis